MSATKEEILGREFVKGFIGGHHDCGRCNGDGWYTVANGKDDFDYITCPCPNGIAYEQAERNGEL